MPPFESPLKRAGVTPTAIFPRNQKSIPLKRAGVTPTVIPAKPGIQTAKTGVTPTVIPAKAGIHYPHHRRA